MEIKNIDEKSYLEYALKSPYISIYQLPEWGTLKESNGWKSHLVGLYDEAKLVGATLLLEKKTPLKKSLFYSPRGYLTDVSNFTLLKIFHEKVIEYIKAHKGFMLKVDPNVIYALRDSEGNLMDDSGKEIYLNFRKLGFKHLGFTKNFETLQPRFLCRFKLLDTYDGTLKTFTKSTQKNIIKTYDMGVRTKKVTVDNIELFTKLLEDTANAKDFIVRPASYYKKMVELMGDYITLYVSYIDTNLYYKYVWDSLENAKKELTNLEEQMKKINVGEKTRKHHADLTNKIIKLERDLKVAEDFRKTNAEINIGALMSIFIGDEGITFMSGTSQAYKDFNPKYAFYNEHIKDTLAKGLKYVNFYGISGDMDKTGPYYGIYELKKGFNPEIVELLGEFDYVINPVVYYAYKIAMIGYKLKKKIKK